MDENRYDYASMVLEAKNWVACCWVDNNLRSKGFKVQQLLSLQNRLGKRCILWLLGYKFSDLMQSIASNESPTRKRHANVARQQQCKARQAAGELSKSNKKPLTGSCSTYSLTVAMLFEASFSLVYWQVYTHLRTALFSDSLMFAMNWLTFNPSAPICLV